MCDSYLPHSLRLLAICLNFCWCTEAYIVHFKIHTVVFIPSYCTPVKPAVLRIGCTSHGPVRNWMPLAACSPKRRFSWITGDRVSSNLIPSAGLIFGSGQTACVEVNFSICPAFDGFGHRRNRKASHLLLQITVICILNSPRKFCSHGKRRR